jgi:DNA polymerase-3 subunit epsilon
VNTLLAIDLETTGTRPNRCEVVQCAAVAMRAWDLELASRVWLARPSQPIPAGATAVHGITDAMVSDCPDFAQLVPEVEAFAAEHGAECLVTFNGTKFDLPVLRRYDLAWTGAHLDVYRVWQRAIDLELPGAVLRAHRFRGTLGAAYAWATGLEPIQEHDALADCCMTLVVARRLVEQLGWDACMAA